MQREPGSMSQRERESERFQRGDAPEAPGGSRMRSGSTEPPAMMRDRAMVADALTVLAGIWLIVSPFVLGYDDGDGRWNPIVCGALVGLMALARLSGAYRMPALGLLNALIGLWLFVSAFWLADSDEATWNSIILGVIVFVLGMASTAAGGAGRSAGAAGPRGAM